MMRLPKLPVPRPRLFPPKPRQFPSRHPMTIAAGFLSIHGAVMCSDSQESTQTGFLKDNVTKVNVHPINGGKLMFAGAGLPSQSEALEQRIVDALLSPSVEGFDGYQPAIQATVIEFYKQHIWPSGQPSQVAALMIVANDEQECLLKTDQESTIVRCAAGACVGIGAKAAERAMRLLLPETDRLGYRVHSLHHLLAIAAYVIWLAKETVDGCGGPTQIAIHPRHQIVTRNPLGRLLTDLEDAFGDLERYHGDLVSQVLDPAVVNTNAFRRYSDRAFSRMGFLQSWHKVMNLIDPGTR